MPVSCAATWPRQDKTGPQALLEAGQVEEARIAFDESLAARQQLVQQSPSNEQVRADLAQSHRPPAICSLPPANSPTPSDVGQGAWPRSKRG